MTVPHVLVVPVFEGGSRESLACRSPLSLNRFDPSGDRRGTCGIVVAHDRHVLNLIGKSHEGQSSRTKRKPKPSGRGVSAGSSTRPPALRIGASCGRAGDVLAGRYRRWEGSAAMPVFLSRHSGTRPNRMLGGTGATIPRDRRYSSAGVTAMLRAIALGQSRSRRRGPGARSARRARGLPGWLGKVGAAFRPSNGAHEVQAFGRHYIAAGGAVLRL